MSLYISNEKSSCLTLYFPLIFMAHTKTGTWDITNTTCIPEEDSTPFLNCAVNLIPAPPKHGFTDQGSLDAVRNGSANFVQYKCLPGFKLIGENTSTCITDGYWTEPNITCKEIICPKPLQFKNLILKSGNNERTTYKFGDKLSYQCEEGYKLIGAHANILCGVSGKWTRMIGRCTRQTCGKPAIPSSAKITGNSYLYKDQVTISCSSGKSYQLTCDKSGNWAGATETTC